MTSAPGDRTFDFEELLAQIREAEDALPVRPGHPPPEDLPPEPPQAQRFPSKEDRATWSNTPWEEGFFNPQPTTSTVPHNDSLKRYLEEKRASTHKGRVQLALQAAGVRHVSEDDLQRLLEQGPESKRRRRVLQVGAAAMAKGADENPPAAQADREGRKVEQQKDEEQRKSLVPSVPHVAARRLLALKDGDRESESKPEKSAGEEDSSSGGAPEQGVAPAETATTDHDALLSELNFDGVESEGSCDLYQLD